MSDQIPIFRASFIPPNTFKLEHRSSPESLVQHVAKIAASLIDGHKPTPELFASVNLAIIADLYQLVNDKRLWFMPMQHTWVFEG